MSVYKKWVFGGTIVYRRLLVKISASVVDLAIKAGNYLRRIRITLRSDTRIWTGCFHIYARLSFYLRVKGVVLAGVYTCFVLNYKFLKAVISDI